MSNKICLIRTYHSDDYFNKNYSNYLLNSNVNNIDIFYKKISNNIYNKYLNEFTIYNLNDNFYNILLMFEKYYDFIGEDHGMYLHQNFNIEFDKNILYVYSIDNEYCKYNININNYQYDSLKDVIYIFSPTIFGPIIDKCVLTLFSNYYDTFLKTKYYIGHNSFIMNNHKYIERKDFNIKIINYVFDKLNISNEEQLLDILEENKNILINNKLYMEDIYRYMSYDFFINNYKRLFAFILEHMQELFYMCNFDYIYSLHHNELFSTESLLNFKKLFNDYKNFKYC